MNPSDAMVVVLKDIILRLLGFKFICIVYTLRELIFANFGQFCENFFREKSIRKNKFLRNIQISVIRENKFRF